MTFTPTAPVREAFRDRYMREDPPGSNCTPLTHEYERLVGRISPNGCFAWCCASLIQWWYRAGYQLVPTAGVAILKDWSKRGLYDLRFSLDPAIGAAALIGWDGPGTTNWLRMHTGLVFAYRHRDDVDIIEANYQDKVDCWNRNSKYIMGYAIPKFESDIITHAQPAPKPVEVNEPVNIHRVRVEDNPTVYIASVATTAKPVRSHYMADIAAGSEGHKFVEPPIGFGAVAEQNQDGDGQVRTVWVVKRKDAGIFGIPT